MLCPVCRVDNFEGEDSCANCGADLSASDVPEPATDYADHTLGAQLEALGIGEPVIVAPDLPVAAAIRRMHDEGVDCLLVCEADRLLGIFTERDAVLRAAGRRLSAFDVRDVMTPDPVALRSDDTLAVAIHKMAIGGFRHIPVIDGERPLGVVAARDVFRHIATSLA
jgi:CBS domain-containing protein